MLGSQTTTSQGCTNFCLIESRECIPDCFQRCLAVAACDFLLKIAQLQIFTPLHRATQRWDKAQQALEKGGFSDTVGTDDGNLLVALKSEIEWFAGQNAVIANFQITSLEDKAARRPCHFKIKGRLWFFSLKLNDFHLVQFLLTGHGHIPSGDTGLVAVDEILQVRNFLLLALIGCLQLSPLHGMHFLELVIIARITGQKLVFHMIDNVNDVIQERNIMGNQDKGIFIVLQVALKPVNMLGIQVVGRLVQEQDVWFFQEELGQKNLGPLSTRQLSNICIHAIIHDTQSPRHLVNLGIQGIKVTTFQTVLEFTNLFHKGIHIGSLIRHGHVNVIDAAFRLKELVKGGPQHIADRLALFQLGMLVQVTCGHIAGPFYLALIRL